MYVSVIVSSSRSTLFLFVLLVLAVVLVPAALPPFAIIWEVDMEAAKMPAETVVLLEAVGFCLSSIDCL